MILGQPQQPYGQQPYGAPQMGYPAAPGGVKPNNYLAWSIISIFLFWPTGIPAIINAPHRRCWCLIRSKAPECKTPGLSPVPLFEPLMAGLDGDRRRAQPEDAAVDLDRMGPGRQRV